MSYNQYFHNNTRNPSNNNYTFRGCMPHPNYYMPPPSLPPPPPPRSTLQPRSLVQTDQEFLKQWEHFSSRPQLKNIKKSMVIGRARKQLRDLIILFKDIKDKEVLLANNINNMSEEEWQQNMEQVQINRAWIDSCMAKFNNKHIEMLRNMLAKRSTKRIRLKRLKQERMKEKKQKTKDREEKSHRIDEYLQNIKDEITKIKQVCFHD